MNTKLQDRVTPKLNVQVTAIFPRNTASPEAAMVTDGEQRNTETYLAAPRSENMLTQRAVWKHKLKQTCSFRQRESGQAASSFRPCGFSNV